MPTADLPINMLFMHAPQHALYSHLKFLQRTYSTFFALLPFCCCCDMHDSGSATTLYIYWRMEANFKCTTKYQAYFALNLQHFYYRAMSYLAQYVHRLYLCTPFQRALNLSSIYKDPTSDSFQCDIVRVQTSYKINVCT